ncbi:Tat (twin-arginine translocation) pathway signal sequence [Bryocella elongata]|uniref:Tat (Twin-arginine translocation) pathway signal sequence n=1 Tax=Bryocella elongata TaxID=863522 RepID=A0A1H5TFP0_9BACT|nr:Gfo/Idh/MocA family oxidoreductase [Bryocella elongata]SEF60827.1 Tat (twin-arginine translocation) pathway signal sequence [Bryocella elongata]
MVSRRSFLQTMAAGTAGAALGTSARSYAQIMGSNERVNFAVIGLNSRAYAHLSSLKANQANSRVAYVCDVESNILAKYAGAAEKNLGYAPKTEKDFRKVLASKDVDAITIATPDHWHAPMAIAGVQAGKHVYVEKPCSHNPAEGAMLVAAQKKTGKLVQQGSQQRSSPHTIEIVEKIHGGSIGRAYYAKAWYSNVRKSIGYGKPAPVPATLDWDLWQGPAPRQEYKDNVQPYNWHWFRTWGTGETLNNGTHEVDVCRWALGVDFPKKVTANGGRYHFKDDWQFYDTLVTSFAYDDKMIDWECKCCQGMKFYGRDRGSAIMGTEGTVVVDRDGYEIYDLNGRKTSEFIAKRDKTSSQDTIGADSMTDLHFANLIAGIRTGEALHAPVSIGYVAVTMLQLSNIAWEVGRELHLDSTDGKILNDSEAMKGWGREYEKGWAPHV